MMRVKIARLILIFIFLFLVFTLFRLELIEGRNFREKGLKNCIRLLPQEGCRGKILDRNKEVIVDSELTFDLMLLPQHPSRIDEPLLEIAKILGRDFQDLKSAFKTGLIAPNALVTLARNINIRQAMVLEELKSDFPGLVIQPRPQRAYPHKRLASHIIGYLGEIDRWRLTKLADYGYKTKDTVGFGGLEERYDYYLRQEEGGLSVEVDSQARFVRVLGFRQPKSGKDIQLTLDLKLQKIVEDCLGQSSGCVIILQPYSGEILAMASHPNFNPAIFIKKGGSALNQIFHHPDAPLVNRAISSAYPAGSVFKLIVATAALETNKMDLARTFFCPGSIYIGRQEFSCWDTHNEVNLLSAIARSCNIFFYRTGLLLGGQLIHDRAVRFGFSKITGIDLPYEISGFVPSPLWRKFSRFRNWFSGDTANLSIGQAELLVTPLQICRMMAVFANRGFLVTPYIVKAIEGRDVSIFQKKIAALPLKGNTIDYVRQGLRKAVSEASGTANLLSALSVAVAGKTGTAQAPPGAAHGWFTGFFPYKNPKFVMCVFLERGGSGYAASVVAKQIIEKMIQEGLVL